jgi:hypothetical protein
MMRTRFEFDMTFEHNNYQSIYDDFVLFRCADNHMYTAVPQQITCATSLIVPIKPDVANKLVSLKMIQLKENIINLNTQIYKNRTITFLNGNTYINTNGPNNMIMIGEAIDITKYVKNLKTIYVRFAIVSTSTDLSRIYQYTTPNNALYAIAGDKQPDGGYKSLYNSLYGFVQITPAANFYHSAAYFAIDTTKFNFNNSNKIYLFLQTQITFSDADPKATLNIIDFSSENVQDNLDPLLLTNDNYCYLNFPIQQYDSVIALLSNQGGQSNALQMYQIYYEVVWYYQNYLKFFDNIKYMRPTVRCEMDLAMSKNFTIFTDGVEANNLVTNEYTLVYCKNSDFIWNPIYKIKRLPFIKFLISCDYISFTDTVNLNSFVNDASLIRYLEIFMYN